MKVMFKLLTASVLPKGSVVRTLQAWKTIVRINIICSLQKGQFTVSLVILFSTTTCLSWGFEAQSDTFVVPGELFLDLLATISGQNTLLVLEDGGLFLVSPLRL